MNVFTVADGSPGLPWMSRSTRPTDANVRTTKYRGFCRVPQWERSISATISVQNELEVRRGRGSEGAGGWPDEGLSFEHEKKSIALPSPSPRRGWRLWVYYAIRRRPVLPRPTRRMGLFFAGGRGSKVLSEPWAARWRGKADVPSIALELAGRWGEDQANRKHNLGEGVAPLSK